MQIMLINMLGFILIGLIIWWFWMSESRKTKSVNGDVIDIIVDGGIYDPSQINAKVGKAITLRFTRKDASPCAEAVVFPDLNKSQDLPIDKTQDIQLTITQPGEYEFTCPMGMYRGKLFVD